MSGCKENLDAPGSKVELLFVLERVIHCFAGLLRRKAKPAALLGKHAVKCVVSWMKTYVRPGSPGRAVLGHLMRAKNMIEVCVSMDDVFHIARFFLQDGNDPVRVSSRIYND